MADEDPQFKGQTERAEIVDESLPSSDPTKKKRKRTAKVHTLSQFTIKAPTWAYVQLQHLAAAGSKFELDAVTAHLHIVAALSQFLGLHGAAISFDILKTEGTTVWVRVPADDRQAFLAAVGGWVSGKGEGWRVKGTSSWDARAMARDSGQDLFTD